MYRIWWVAKTEMIRMTRIRAFYFILFVLPFVLILILGNALSGMFDMKDREIEPVQVAFVNDDAGGLQEQIRAFFAAEEFGKYVKLKPFAAKEDAVASIRAGDSDFGLIVPAGFSDSVLHGEKAHWEFVYGRDRVKNRTAESVLGVFVEETNTVQAANLALGTAQVGVSEVASHGHDDGATPLVKVGSLNEGGKGVTAIQYYAAAELVMFLLYGGMFAAISLAKEREQHTLSRLNAMPVSPSVLLAGKMLGQGLLAVVQAAVMIAGTSLLYGVDWGDHWGALAALVAGTIVASMGIALLISLFARTHKAVMGVFQTIIIFMTLVSGGFTQVSGLLEQIGRYTVSFWSFDGLNRVMLGSGIQSVAQHLTVLWAIAAGLLLVSIAVYRKVGYHE